MLLCSQLLLLVDDALVNDGVHLVKCSTRIVRQQDLLLAHNPLLLLLTQVHHLLLLDESLPDFFVRSRLLHWCLSGR